MSIEVWYGGKLVGRGNNRKYVGGTLYTIDEFDIDRFGYMELRYMLKEVKLYKDYVIWLKLPGSEMELRQIKTDSDVIGMLAYMENNVNVILLIEHLKPGEGQQELLPSYCLEDASEQTVGVSTSEQGVDKGEAFIDVEKLDATQELHTEKAPMNAVMQECVDEFLREIKASERQSGSAPRPSGRAAREARRAARAVGRAAMFKKMEKQKAKKQQECKIFEIEEEEDVEYMAHETEVTEDSECDWEKYEVCASSYELRPRVQTPVEGMEMHAMGTYMAVESAQAENMQPEQVLEEPLPEDRTVERESGQEETMQQEAVLEKLSGEEKNVEGDSGQAQAM